MSAGVEVRPVRDAADDRAFCELPYRLYARDPLWVPPLHTAERARWRTDHNPSLRARWHDRFLAVRDGRVVGRIAAIVDPAFARRWSAGAGFVGFFECERDAEASGALLRAAERTLRDRGTARVLGPINLTTHDEVGLLVDGFSRPAAVQTPYNPPFYASLLAGAGYVASRDYHAFEWTPASPESAPLRRLARRASAVAIRHVDPRRFANEVRLLHGLYNASFSDLWGFVPMTADEFRVRAEQFKAFYRPDLVLVAEQQGEPAGFAMLLPDAHEALPAARGRLLPFGWLRLHRALARVQRGRFVLMGVRPRFAGRGLAVQLALAMGRAVEAAGYAGVEVSLVLDSNARMRRVIEGFGCRLARTYRLFEKDLAP